MATHSSILAWRIPWTEESGGGYSSWGCKELDTHTHTGAQTWLLRWSQPFEKKKRKQSLPEIRGSWCLQGQRAEPLPEGRCRRGGVSFHWLIRLQHHDHLVEHGRKCRFPGSTPLLLFQNLRGKDPRLCILNRFSRVSLSFSHTHTHTHTHTYTHTLKFKNIVLNLKHFWNTVMSVRMTLLGNFSIDKSSMLSENLTRPLPKLSPISFPGEPKTFSGVLYQV